MKFETLKEKTLDELQALLRQEFGSLVKLRIRARNGSLQQTHLLGQTRKTIARIHQLIQEKAS